MCEAQFNKFNVLSKKKDLPEAVIMVPCIIEQIQNKSNEQYNNVKCAWEIIVWLQPRVV